MIACRYWKATFCLAIGIQTAPTCFAAERYVFDVFDQDRGLGNSAVTRLAKDHQGYLWIGTENGLYRYDGHRFLAFTTSDGLPSNKITAIHESQDGTLWVGTLEGLAWREGAGFRKSSNEDLKGYISLQGIASDHTGRVFIATRKGIAVTAPPTAGKDMGVTFLPWPAAVPQQRAFSVYVVSPDEVWFGCDIAICRWNGRDTRVWDRTAGVPQLRWNFFLKDKSGNLWARNRDALIELAAGADRFSTIDQHFPNQVSIAPELAMDRKGRILVTTDRGLLIGDPSGWRLVTQRQGLPIAFVTALLQDAEGSMWVGTYGAGLARWAGYDVWRSFTELEGLASSSILSLLEDPPLGMWAGTAAGLSHGVFSKGTWNWSEVSIPGVGWASSLARAKDGALWMLTDGHYVVRYDPVSHAVRRLGPFGQGPFHLRIDSAGQLWIADSGGITVGDAQSGLEDFEKIHPPGTSANTVFTATLEDARGDLWIGSMSGLFRRSQGKWFRYGESDGLRATRVTDLTLSPEGDVWVSYSEPKGTDRVRVAGDRVQVENFDRSKGLTSDRVNSTAFDRKGQLWILNDLGVSVRRGDTWVQFGRADGMIASISTGRVFAAGVDGAIWIGGERGLSRYEPPATVEVQSEPLTVRYSEVRIGKRTLNPESGAFVEATPQPFEAKFSALLLVHGPEVKYRYRIVGFDDRWQETRLPEVQLDYLPPGKYRLEVQARRVAQPWIGSTATLALDVRPRWFEAPLFRGMMLVLVCAILWSIGKFRQRRALMARRTLEREVDQRTAELRESEERFRNMADTAPVMIWTSGPDRQYTFLNKGWLKFTGRALEQELGKGWASDVHPDDLDRCLTTYSSAFDERTSFQMDFRLRRADGAYRWVLDSGVPRFAPGNIFEGYIGSCVDITDVKLAEQDAVVNQAVRESEEKYHGIVETMTEGVWILDHEDRTSFVNQQMATMLGYRVEEMFGRELLDFKDDEARPIAEETLKRLRQGITEQYDSTFQTKDGRCLKVLISSRPLLDENGRYIGSLGIITDITERMRLEERLHQANKMEAIGRLAGGVAHDFNNLLTVINGYSSLLLRNLDAGDRIRTELIEIRSAGQRAQELTSQMLAFSRSRIRTTEILRLQNVIEDVEKMLRRIIGEDIVLVTRFEPGLGTIRADRTELTQILLNLAVNARDAMPTGGTLSFETRDIEVAENYARNHPGAHAGAYVLLTVSDTGVGMDTEVQQHLFEPFFTTKQAGKGTGLGLANVYGIVSQRGGWIWVDSKPRGGTTFRIYLPRVDGAASVVSPHPELTSQPLRGTETILVVEDQHQVRKLTCAILRDFGYQILEAPHGEEALRLSETHSGPLHLLLTDMILPGMHGLELATRLKTNRGTKVLLMSGYLGSSEAGHDIGVDYIQKPFTPDALVRKVQEILGAADAIRGENPQE